MNFKDYLKEKVSPDCSDGPGVIPIGPWKDFKVIRTSHLDDDRKTGKDRDFGWQCDEFDTVMTKLFQKRPLGIKDAKYTITWKNKKGYQSAVVSINNKKKTATFITIMQLNKKSSRDYIKSGTTLIDLGPLKIPN